MIEQNRITDWVELSRVESIDRMKMDEQESNYNPNLSSSHYAPMMSNMNLPNADVKYNLYDTNLDENKPLNDVNSMLQQIMSIVDQSLDEAQAKFVFIFYFHWNQCFFIENTPSIRVDWNQHFIKFFAKSRRRQVCFTLNERDKRLI